MEIKQKAGFKNGALHALFCLAVFFIFALVLAACSKKSNSDVDQIVQQNLNPADNANARPLLSFSTSNSFGAVTVGTAATNTTTVTNAGAAPAKLLLLLTNGDGFEWSGNQCTAGLTLAVATSCSFQLTVIAAAEGIYTATQSIGYSGGSDLFSLAFTMTATATLQAPNVTSSQNSYDFGSVVVGASARKIFGKAIFPRTQA